jgi:hypothetical protein
MLVAAVTLGVLDADGAQSVAITRDDVLFGDCRLSMHRFKCLEGPEQLWRRAPCP